MRITAAMTDATLPPQSGPAADEAPDERALLRAVASGDRSAAERLVGLTYRRIWSHLFRMTGGDADLAADLTQESYRKAWAALAGFDGRSAFSTWLHRIATTTYLNHQRRPRRVVAMDEATERSATSREPSAEASAARAQGDDRLRRAVLGLPDGLRDMVVARYWGEVPVRELAAAEGISEVAVRKRLRKALSILETTLEVTS
jgi:RNA polymerase sigma-70 factor (ECF subfamily)